jgi:hypothetical protein
MARDLDSLYRQVEPMAIDIKLRADEHPLLVLRGSGVVELRAGRGTAPRNTRVSPYQDSNGSPYPARIHHGTFVTEPGAQRVIASDGTAIITNQRVLYTSPAWHRVWEYAKTGEAFHFDSVATGWAASYIRVANRTRTSGFLYRIGFARSVRDRLMLAMAVADGSLEDLVLALKAERAELDRS